MADIANRWVVSDPHFFHKNILTFTNKDGQRIRDFASVEEMHETIRVQWSYLVRPQDLIYVLGDITMMRGKGANTAQLETFIKSLPGHKRVVLGNHDHLPVDRYLKMGFEKVFGSRQLDHIWLTHIPMAPWSLSPKFLGNVHGHVHESMPYYYGHRNREGTLVKYINVSMEAVSYTPVAWEELTKTLDRDPLVVLH